MRRLLGWLPASFWRVLARAFRVFNRPALAARAYTVAAYVAPQNALNQHDRGMALAALGRHQAAIHAFRQALKLNPQLGHSQRGLARMNHALGRHGEAARAFARAVELLPEDAQLYHELGASLAQLGRHDAAAQAFSQAVRLKPGRVGWHRALGRAYRADGQHAEAAAALAQVARLQPDDAKAHFEEGREWLLCGAVTQALEPLQKALALAPEHADSAFALRACQDAISAKPAPASVLKNQAAPRRVGCLLGGGIGNLIQCSPAIRRLADSLGQPVDVMLIEDFPGCTTLFSGAPWVATVFAAPDEARAVQFDLLVVMDPFAEQMPALSAEHWIVPRLTLPREAMQQLHEAEYHLKGLRLQLGIAYQQKDVGAYFIGRYTRQPGFPLRVGLHAGCKSGRWLAKRWPYFESLAAQLSAAGLEVLSFGGPGEAVAGTTDRTGLALPETVEQIATCAYFIANDSGLMHVADALGIPLTAIFAPSSVTKNGPLCATSQVVQLNKDCAPCQFDTPRLKRCKCIGEITLDEVLSKVTQHLNTLSGFSSVVPSLKARLLPPELIPAQLLDDLPLAERLRQVATAHDPLARLQADLREQRYSSRLVEMLIEARAWHAARELLAGTLGSPKALLQLGPRRFTEILRWSWVLGAQQELTQTLVNAAASLCKTYPDSVLALFDSSTSVLAPARLDALLLACAPPLLAGRPVRPAQELILAGCQHGSPTALAHLLDQVDGCAHFDLLRSPALVGQIGDALLDLDLAFNLPRSGLSADDFRANASLERLIEQALHTEDRPAFVARVNEFLGQHRGADYLSRLLKNFTRHTVKWRLQPGEINYGIGDSHQDNLLLATLLNDDAMIEHSARKCAPDELATLLRSTRHNDYGPLNTALARWLGAAGAAAVSFSGRSRLEIFQACLAMPALPAAPDQGRVSVILCVHAPEPELLRLAVASVLWQTYENMELILVDDGNDAAIAQLLGTFAGPRVRVVRNAQNGGVYQCRNLGVAAAQGHFIAFHDADDIAHPQRLQVQLAALLETPGCQLCFASHMRFDADGALQPEIHAGRLSALGDGPVTALLRRSTLDTVGPFLEVRTRGDIELRDRIEKCFGKYAIRHVQAPLMYCAGSPGTLSNRAMTRYRHQIRLLRLGFTLRIWPPVIAGALQAPPVGAIAVPYALRSSTSQQA